MKPILQTWRNIRGRYREVRVAIRSQGSGDATRPAHPPKDVAGDAAFFAEGAAIRRVHSEAVVLLGGGRALLMQVAHPAIAAAVSRHSSFRGSRRERLMGTLRPTLAIVFGTEREARAAAASINDRHREVSGDGYSALDPELLFWVLATLIDTALLMHGRFLAPLPPAEAEAYYQDMLTAGALLGVRRDLAPQDIAAFSAYMADAIAALSVTEEARTIAADLFRTDGIQQPAWFALRGLTASLLPSSLQEPYGFPASPRRDILAKASAAASRALLPRLRLALRGTPSFLLPPSGRASGGMDAAPPLRHGRSESG